MELMNQFLKNHQLNKAEIGVTDESISDWICGLQDTFSSTLDHTNDGQANLKQYKKNVRDVKSCYPTQLLFWHIILDVDIPSF